MRKLKMDVAQLQVEAFDVAGSRLPLEGTVLGRQPAWTFGCTRSPYYPCNEPTNAALDANCYDSNSPGEGNCTNVCASGALVCDTNGEFCA